MAYNEAAFKKRWPRLAAPGALESLQREYGRLSKLSSYELCNLRAERNKAEAAARTFEPRCSTPDDGKFFFEDAANRPMEAPPQIEIWDIIGMEMVREAWRDAREEAPLAKVHDVQAQRETERLAN